MSGRFARPPGRFPDGCPECDGKGGHLGSCPHSGLVDPIADRRQRAREAFFDTPALDMRQGFEDAIEVATQVKITDDIIDAYYDGFPASASARERATALLRAAGFEVVE